MFESDIENKVVKRALEELGVPSLKLNGTGNTGWPDRIFWIPGGKPLLIEFKRPGEDTRARQQYVHKILQVLEYQVEVHDDEIRALQSIARALGAAELREEGGEVPAGAPCSRPVPGSWTWEDINQFGSAKVIAQEKAAYKSPNHRTSSSLSSSMAKRGSKVEGLWGIEDKHLTRAKKTRSSGDRG